MLENIKKKSQKKSPFILALKYRGSPAGLSKSLTGKKVLIAAKAGFCSGVRRAVELAQQAVAKAKTSGIPIYSLGRLVHNHHVVAELEKLGLKVIQEISQVKGPGYLIISAHGQPPEVAEAACRRGLEIIDTTCSQVLKVQELAKKICARGITAVLVGDQDHPEVKAVVGGIGGEVLVVNNKTDCGRLKKNARAGVLAQTTQTKQLFEEIVTELKDRGWEVEEYNTICSATKNRQASAAQLAQKVEVMIVIGDRVSGNTKRLYEICRQSGTPAFWVESAAELNLDWLTGKEKIGLTAGASTPDEIIREIKSKIESSRRP